MGKMKTERLFDKSSKIDRFEAIVLSCEQLENGQFAAVFDKTAFFPNEGGQSCDTGVIEGATVLSVDEMDGIITHMLDKPLVAGQTVSCQLDYMVRFKKMQNHTAEHIVSGIIHADYGFDNVGFHLGEGYMTADFNGELTPEMLDDIEYKANLVTAACKQIKTCYPDEETLKGMEYRSKLDFYENVRIVEIEDIDECACCAPHVENTGEVGIIKILDAIRYKGGTRITMIAGLDALTDYKSRFSKIKHISMAISAKQSEVAEGVDRLLDEMGKLKGTVSALKREIMNTKLEAMENTDGSIILFEEFDDMLALRNLANDAVKKCGKVFAVFSRNDDGYKYIIASNTLDLKALSHEINAAIDGRGGGSKQMIQGSCTASEETIKTYFSSETYN